MVVVELFLPFQVEIMTPLRHSLCPTHPSIHPFAYMVGLHSSHIYSPIDSSKPIQSQDHASSIFVFQKFCTSPTSRQVLNKFLLRIQTSLGGRRNWAISRERGGKNGWDLETTDAVLKQLCWRRGRCLAKDPYEGCWVKICIEEPGMFYHISFKAALVAIR